MKIKGQDVFRGGKILKKSPKSVKVTILKILIINYTILFRRWAGKTSYVHLAPEYEYRVKHLMKAYKISVKHVPWPQNI